ncbi:hypothetical protein KC353_g68 [Hortaea werneckii]|nr:hypothetical protein KC353_g68 [Hortaea werneckii]
MSLVSSDQVLAEFRRSGDLDKEDPLRWETHRFAGGWPPRTNLSGPPLASSRNPPASRFRCSVCCRGTHRHRPTCQSWERLVFTLCSEPPVVSADLVDDRLVPCPGDSVPIRRRHCFGSLVEHGRCSDLLALHVRIIFSFSGCVFRRQQYGFGLEHLRYGSVNLRSLTAIKLHATPDWTSGEIPANTVRIVLLHTAWCEKCLTNARRESALALCLLHPPSFHMNLPCVTEMTPYRRAQRGLLTVLSGRYRFSECCFAVSDKEMTAGGNKVVHVQTNGCAENSHYHVIVQLLEEKLLPRHEQLIAAFANRQCQRYCLSGSLDFLQISRLAGHTALSENALASSGIRPADINTKSHAVAYRLLIQALCSTLKKSKGCGDAPVLTALPVSSVPCPARIACISPKPSYPTTTPHYGVVDPCPYCGLTSARKGLGTAGSISTTEKKGGRMMVQAPPFQNDPSLRRSWVTAHATKWFILDSWSICRQSSPGSTDLNSSLRRGQNAELSLYGIASGGSCSSIGSCPPVSLLHESSFLEMLRSIENVSRVSPSTVQAPASLLLTDGFGKKLDPSQRSGHVVANGGGLRARPSRPAAGALDPAAEKPLVPSFVIVSLRLCRSCVEALCIRAVIFVPTRYPADGVRTTRPRDDALSSVRRYTCATLAIDVEADPSPTRGFGCFRSRLGSKLLPRAFSFEHRYQSGAIEYYLAHRRSLGPSTAPPGLLRDSDQFRGTVSDQARLYRAISCRLKVMFRSLHLTGGIIWTIVLVIARTVSMVLNLASIIRLRPAVIAEQRRSVVGQVDRCDRNSNVGSELLHLSKKVFLLTKLTFEGFAYARPPDCLHMVPKASWHWSKDVFSFARATAMRPPVPDPTIKSKRACTGRCPSNACSIARRISNCTIPRMPPPSRTSTRTPAPRGLYLTTFGCIHRVACWWRGHHEISKVDCVRSPHARAHLSHNARSTCMAKAIGSSAYTLLQALLSKSCFESGLVMPSCYDSTFILMAFRLVSSFHQDASPPPVRTDKRARIV